MGIERRERVPPGGRRGIGGHALSNEGRSDDWLTPPDLLARLGPFDLDPCASATQPWPTARRMIAPPAHGLMEPWSGRVFMNPPYGAGAEDWLRRLALHGIGTALVFARTETAMFFESVWPHASALLFLRGRLYFHRPDGSRADGNAGGPSVLIAYGPDDAEGLAGASDLGALVRIWRP